MIYKEYIFSEGEKKLSEGSFTWMSPSNIALVKYWGKYEDQIPANASLSFTLSKCYTETTLKFKPVSKPASVPDFEVFLDGEPAEHFKKKIRVFLERIVDYIPFIKNYEFEIYTHNTFPHSSGIASSASGMSALALCLMQMEVALNPETTKEYFLEKVGFLARLGSGSACRSISGPVMAWGKHPKIKGSSDLFAVANPFEMHPVFSRYQNSILLVEEGKKSVSSSYGHEVMMEHLFAEIRFKQANDNLSDLIKCLKSGDLDEFIRIVEAEALTLHGLMFTSKPYYILMKPNTLEIIQRVWNYRKKTGSKLCFTLDAGANVHLLYPEEEKERVRDFIEFELTRYCQNGRYIHDSTGLGAQRIN